MNWTNAFDQKELEEGRKIFESGRTAVTGARDGSYSGVIRDGSIYNTFITPVAENLQKGFRAQCNCKNFSTSRACRHIAATLFSITEKQEEAGKAISFLDAAGRGNDGYFDIVKIYGRFRNADRFLLKAKELLDDPTSVFSVPEVLYAEDGTQGQIIRASAQFGGSLAYIILSRDRIEQHVCHDPECAVSDRYFTRYTFSECPHTLALLIHTLRWIIENAPGDETDRSASSMIDSYIKARTSRRIVSDRSTLELTPKLMLSEEEAGLQFRVSSGKGRAFVIKDLSEFCDALNTSSDMSFGKDTVININREHMDERALAFADLIVAGVGNDRRMKRLLRSRYPGFTPSGVLKTLPLYGDILDRFFDLIGDGAIDAKSSITSAVKHDITEIRAKDADPPVELDMELMYSDSAQIKGIRCRYSCPFVISGITRVYWFSEDGFLCRSSEGFMQRLREILPCDIGEERVLYFTVGMKKINVFMKNILPELRQMITVRFDEEAALNITLPPDCRIEYLLDSDEGTVKCRVVSVYDDNRYDITDPSEDADRDYLKEAMAVETARRYLPILNEEEGVFTCGDDGDSIYELLLNGVDEMNSIGEVHATDSFAAVRLNRKVSASVGVSVESGIMQLEISADGLSQTELREVLESYRARKKYHRLKSGDLVNLESESVQMLDELFRQMGKPLKEFVDGKMEIPAYRALYLDRMLEEHSDIYARRDSVFRNIVSSFTDIGDAEFIIPPSLEKVLRPYQKEGFRWLRTLETFGFGGILADDMGLGKTIQMISVLLAAKEEGRPCGTLIICPASLVFNWGEELKRFAPELDFTLITGSKQQRSQLIKGLGPDDIAVTSYDLIKRDVELYDSKSFTYEILDEAQYIKNQTTSGAKSVKLIKAVQRFALTGTPIENRLSELWSIFDFLMPGFLYSYDTFRSDIETPIIKYDDEAVSERLRRMCAPFILRRLKGDVLRDLPEKIEKTVYASLDTEQRNLYDAQIVRLKDLMEGSEDINKKRFEILTQLLRLRQICCAPSLCYENYSGENAKLETCMQLVESAVDSSHKVLLFSQFTSMLDIIKAELDRRKISYKLLTGSTPKEARLSMVNSFNTDDTSVFLISLKAGGTGLNLTGADMVIHYDPWWNTAVQDQATDRAHRIGQKNTVTVYRLIAKDSIEEKIAELQDTKKELADNILSGENVDLAAMTRDELMDLLVN